MFCEFMVLGEVRGKGRPRFVRKTDVAYTPEKTRGAERAVGFEALRAMVGRKPTNRFVHLDLLILKPMPKKHRPGAPPFPRSRFDLDNIVKLIGDACNKIVWDDDRQIARLTAERRFSQLPEQTIVRVYEL